MKNFDSLKILIDFRNQNSTSKIVRSEKKFLKLKNFIDFILSCRVVGRYIEETMIEFLKEFCQENNVNKIKGKYKKTDKNSLCYNFLNKLQLIDNNQYSFEFPSNKKKLNLLNITVKKPTYKEKINASKNIMAK